MIEQEKKKILNRLVNVATVALALYGFGFGDAPPTDKDPKPYEPPVERALKGVGELTEEVFGAFGEALRNFTDDDNALRKSNESSGSAISADPSPTSNNGID